MERKCYKYGAPIIGKKCDYCGSKNKKVAEQSFVPKEIGGELDSDGQVNQHPEVVVATKWHKFFSIVGAIAALLFVIGIIFSQLTPTTASEYRYVCSNTQAPNIDGVTTVVIIESYGLRIRRWIEQDTFPRQTYIDHFWGLDWDVSDQDIIDWFEGPFNIMEMEGTYWELVSIDDDFVITNFIYDYENMSRADLDQLWTPNFSGVNRHSAIRVLEEDRGAICVRE